MLSANEDRLAGTDGDKGKRERKKSTGRRPAEAKAGQATREIDVYAADSDPNECVQHGQQFAWRLIDNQAVFVRYNFLLPSGESYRRRRGCETAAAIAINELNKNNADNAYLVVVLAIVVYMPVVVADDESNLLAPAASVVGMVTGYLVSFEIAPFVAPSICFEGCFLTSVPNDEFPAGQAGRGEGTHALANIAHFLLHTTAKSFILIFSRRHRACADAYLTSSSLLRFLRRGRCVLWRLNHEISEYRRQADRAAGGEPVGG